MKKINMGCGETNFGGDWIHIDKNKYLHVNEYDAANLSFEDYSIDLIYSSYLLQYFDNLTITSILSEWYRVLLPGGLLRISVPSFESITLMYSGETCELSDIINLIYNPISNDDVYKNIFDYTTLQKLLIETGFEEIRFWEWDKVNHGIYNDNSQNYFPKHNKESGILLSLNLECNKPIMQKN